MAGPESIRHAVTGSARQLNSLLGSSAFATMVVNYTISDVLGFASIGCWLGAQFPQVLENIRRQSCEGLALPFLANWFLGDISNLIGCILTHQLPFQTYLATYFVFVDCMLLMQYFYYYQPPKTLPPIHGHLRSATLPLPSRRLSIGRYRTLSAVASNVANAAALAAYQDEPEGRHASRHASRSATHRNVVTDRETEPGDEDREPPADMLESFYSEGGRGSSSRRVSWSIERSRNRAASVGHTIRRPPRLNLLPTDGLSSPVSEVPPSHEQNLLDSPLSPTVATARSSQARRGSALVFLGVWALFGFGTLKSQSPMYFGSSTRVGMVLSSIVSDVRSVPAALGNTIGHAPTISIRSPDVPAFTFVNEPAANEPLHDPGQQSSERVVGRIFAWTCATLYFTSRLPQIWKNYARKSVEGLSMYLFVFAFLGNTFYVASIICSPRRLFPPHEASAFIRESIPYLVGSAGTLMFDVTIVSQSFCYRPRHRRHSNAVLARALEEEESSLLSDDALHPATESSSILHRGRTSHVLTST